MDYVRDIDQDAFGQAVLQRSHEVPVVVDFWAEWCGPCKTLSPVLEKLAAEYDGGFELVKIDVDNNQELSKQFGIQGIPNVIGFRNGQPASRFTGALPESAVREWLGGLLPSDADRLVEAARDEVIEGNSLRGEELFKEALGLEADHADAGTGLAALLIARGDTEEALIVLGKLTPSSETERLAAAARVTASQGGDIGELEAAVEAEPESEAALIALGRALAAKSEHEPALDYLLKAVSLKGSEFEEARQSMVDVFGILGNEHPLTAEYRRRLASQLF